MPFVLEMQFFVETSMLATLGIYFSYSLKINVDVLALMMENGAKQWWATGQKTITLLQN